ncbi:uncharacterized protein LOC129886716 [Solanum dulcamara]|uniref:uncharacterized protein LOC129886716 n=1 Tax=Solanum dulcamara TaxID=45834 RepID=UPI0024865FE5|nr:uncharacterized protein LOC129886716 [Solanum dulcamara]
MDFSGQYQHQQQGAADPSQIQAYDPSIYAQYPQQGASQIQPYDQSQYQQQQQPADPSQIQAYDPSTQAYYAYQYNQQYQYSSYYPQDYYSNAYQQQQYQPEPTSIHPPGVPIPPSSDPYATQQQPQYSYYPQQQQQQQQGINYGEVATATMPNVSHTPAIVPSPYKDKGKRGGRPYRGGAHGHLGGGQLQPSYALPTYAENQPKVFQGASQIQGGLSQVKPSSSASGNSAPVRPPRMAWCELCRIECNTPEVLEQHKNGKKHKKNLKAYEERQKLNKQMDGAHGHQTTNSEVKTRVAYQPAVEGSGQLPLGHLPSETVTGDRQLLPKESLPPHDVIEEDGSITGKQKVEETAPVDHVQGQGRGVKRSLRGGRGGKLMKTQNGSRKPAVPPKPQKMVPLICELCNVKCESVVVFQSHLAGRKHLSNVKDFQGQQAMVGQAALQALYPALQALYPALQALCQPNTGASTSVAPQGHQHNLHEILGVLTQQALSAIPQDQLLGIGAAAASAFPPPSDLLAQDHQGSKLQGSVSEETRGKAAAEDGRNCDLSVLQNTVSKPEENTDNKHENVNLEVERKVMSVKEPFRFAASGDVSSTSRAVSGAVSVSNSEVVSSDSAAHSGLDGKLAD